LYTIAFYYKILINIIKVGSKYYIKKLNLIELIKEKVEPSYSWFCITLNPLSNRMDALNNHSFLIFILKKESSLFI